jgi:hypothetical protein
LLCARHVLRARGSAAALRTEAGNRRTDLGQQAEGLNGNAAPLRLFRQRGIGAVVLRVERGLCRRYALPLIGEIVLLKAGKRVRSGVAGTIERVGSSDLIADVLIVLAGDTGASPCAIPRASAC